MPSADLFVTLVNAGIAGVFAIFAIYITKQFLAFLEKKEMINLEMAKQIAILTNQITILATQIANLTDATDKLCIKTGITKPKKALSPL